MTKQLRISLLIASGNCLDIAQVENGLPPALVDINRALHPLSNGAFGSMSFGLAAANRGSRAAQLTFGSAGSMPGCTRFVDMKPPVALPTGKSLARSSPLTALPIPEYLARCVEAAIPRGVTWTCS